MGTVVEIYSIEFCEEPILCRDFPAKAESGDPREVICGLPAFPQGPHNPGARRGLTGSDTKSVAEREGFEPPIGLHLCRISSAVHSTTLPPLQAP